MLTRKDEIEWLISYIPGGAKEIKMIYNGRENGFRKEDFHSKCDCHTYPTITLMKSKAGKIFGGYT